GTDPGGECAPQLPCGQDGTCNGVGGCRITAGGTPCGDTQSCSNGVQTNQDVCNGSGTCADNGTTSCGAYVCSGATCKGSCAGDGTCGNVANGTDPDSECSGGGANNCCPGAVCGGC